MKAPEELLNKPYLAPSYDEPEFVVRNVWRRYGGWYDGNPANLRPAPRADLAREITGLAGGVVAMVQRARDLLERGELRLAGHLVQMAADADPDDRGVHEARAEVFHALEHDATSTMAKGVYGWAVSESKASLEGTDLSSVLNERTAGRKRWAF